MNDPLPLTSKADRNAARSLVDSTCLNFEDGFDDLLGIFDSGRLIACGARAARVLKMLVLEKAHRGSNSIWTSRRGRDWWTGGTTVHMRT